MMRNVLVCMAPVLLFAAVLRSRPLSAQTDAAPALEPSTARVAVLPTALYTAQANMREDADTTKSGIATDVISARLGQLLGRQAIRGAPVAALLESPATRHLRGDQSCAVVVSCARALARQVGASWVVMTKVSKTSNLIWLFTGQLIDVPTGRIVLDDSTELKGEPDRMVRVGTRIFAERVARTIENGGRVTNFPTPQTLTH